MSKYGQTGIVKKVWNKMPNVKGKDENYKRDPYGNVLYKHSYGKDTKMGWNIDHIKPKSKGGSDCLVNLQALQTSKNKSLGNKLIKRRIK